MMKIAGKPYAVAVICLFAFFAVMIQGACRKDKCSMVTCDNGGICDGGVCFCPPGYEGPTCDTIPRNKFLGNWTATKLAENSTSSIQYTVSISPSYPVYNVFIRNLDNSFSQNITAFVSSDDSLIIPDQILQGKRIAGYCYYASGTGIEAHYSITDTATNAVQSVSTTWY